jgi:hypothetical protein
MKAILILLSLLFSTSTYAKCYKDSIISPTPFLGNNDEIFKLASGSIWQVKYEYEYLYEYYPSVIICPDSGKLIIKNKKLNIQAISVSPSSSLTSGSDLIESQIDGEFKGWEGETIYKLTNGQVWQQASYSYSYSYSFMPRVLIYQQRGNYFMKVQDREPVQVKRLR